MKFDMHCHTKEGSMDGRVPIEQYIEILKSKGFDGMLVSDHNSYKGYRAWKKIKNESKYKDFVVLKGIEYDTIDAGHILVIMPEGVKLPVLELRGMPAQLLIDIVHKYGGILGPAHPCGERFLSIFNTRKYRLDTNIMKQFDFIEAFNACESEKSNYMAGVIAGQYDKPVFGGSDAHRAGCVGLAYTAFPNEIKNESDLIACVKDNKGISCGGIKYTHTTKQKIGRANDLLVQGFWFYNRFAGLWRSHKRKFELYRLNDNGQFM